MASSTTHVELSSLQKAELDEMIKEAEPILAEYKVQHVTEVGGAVLPLIVLEGYLRAVTLRPLTLFDSKLWAGKIVKDYPNPLDGSISTFAQISVKDDGIMSAVVYTGKNIAGVECGWLLAWADSKANGKRLYAECGVISKFNCIDWERIEEKLINSGLLAIIVIDGETGTSVYAKLTGVDFPMQTQDQLAAIFSG
ncbi:jasmonate-induced protein homolog [Chenopodium quinoa]|uniref:Uncharacterized protein n=1 Tax=Chenopodium quinoa TaxID=63459 RepID=A0A803LG34_CHEQI|nr:jasmonate-induced protein homolog [Chenopodium quinoa]